ncbi:hypothetical protein [Uliginosibacterium gangwonense]|uniref:hypothetical protein n=1 Tax=Uliginosibacterium gangwonense TaxID=392736 RepID=UPI000364829D|nr:hypothetical protein [Uliginosibacterium gangwonense]
MALGDYIGQMMRGAGDWMSRKGQGVGSRTATSIQQPASVPRPGGPVPIDPSVASNAVSRYGSASAAEGPLASTAVGARANGMMSPEAAAFRASQTPNVASTTEAPAQVAGQASRLAKFGKGLGLAGGVLQTAGALGDMGNRGVNADNATDFAAGGALTYGLLANPAVATGAGALTAGKFIGKNLVPDNMAVGLARAWNSLTGNSAANRTEPGLQVNQDLINQIAKEHPNGMTAGMLSGQPMQSSQEAPALSQQVPQQTVQPVGLRQPVADLINSNGVPPAGTGWVRNNSTGKTMNVGGQAQGYQPVDAASVGGNAGGGGNQPTRRVSNEQSVGAPPAIDTSLESNDPSGMKTLFKLYAQQPAAAQYAGAINRAKTADNLGFQYANLDTNADLQRQQMQQQGLFKAADLAMQRQNLQYNREMAINQLGYQRRMDNEKRINDQLDKDFGQAYDKDNKPNQARQKAELGFNNVLAQAGLSRGDITPQMYNVIHDAVQSPAWDTDPGILNNLVQKLMGYSTSTTNNPLKATAATGLRGPGGVGFVTGDNRLKFGSSLGYGGLVDGGNQEAQDRYRQELQNLSDQRR